MADWRMIAAILAAACVGGCEDAKPRKYTVSGLVTYDGQPIDSGDIIFEPKHGLRNVETMSRSFIANGRYTAEIVGGPHFINVRGTGLAREYRGEVDYADVQQVRGPGAVVKDIEIPRLEPPIDEPPIDEPPAVEVLDPPAFETPADEAPAVAPSGDPAPVEQVCLRQPCSRGQVTVAGLGWDADRPEREEPC